MLIDKVLLKKKFHVIVIFVYLAFLLEVRSARTFENFSRCFAGFFLPQWNDACS